MSFVVQMHPHLQKIQQRPEAVVSGGPMTAYRRGVEEVLMNIDETDVAYAVRDLARGPEFRAMVKAVLQDIPMYTRQALSAALARR